MAEYGEGTRSVLERAVTLLGRELPEAQIHPLESLLAEGRFDDLDALEAALGASSAKDSRDGD